jgi:hypothetical protein
MPAWLVDWKLSVRGCELLLRSRNRLLWDSKKQADKE